MGYKDSPPSLIETNLGKNKAWTDLMRKGYFFTPFRAEAASVRQSPEKNEKQRFKTLIYSFKFKYPSLTSCGTTQINHQPVYYYNFIHGNVFRNFFFFVLKAIDPFLIFYQLLILDVILIITLKSRKGFLKLVHF